MQTGKRTVASLSVEPALQDRPLLQPAKGRYLVLPLLVAAALYLYAQSFYSPSVPLLLRGDQTFFWVYAQRMLNGEKAYRNFFQFTPPGTDIFYATLFKLFSSDIWVMNLAVLLLGIALCWLCFYLAQQFMRQGTAVLVAVLFLVFLYGSRLDATHHWFSLLAALCGVIVLLQKRTILRIAIAGILMGVASFFTQTAGAAGVIALLISLAWEHDSQKMPWSTILKNQALLLLAFCLTCSALFAPFIASVGWRQLWFLLVAYPQHYVIYEHQFLFPPLSGIRTPRALPGNFQVLFVYLLMLVIYPAVLWHCRRSRRDCMPLVLLSMTGLFLLFEIITRINVNRLYGIAMPALILLFWAIDRREKIRRYAATVWVIVVCVAILQTISRHQERRQLADLPAGKAALFAEDFEELSWLEQHTRPGDFFFQSSWLNVYPPLRLRSPVFIDGLWPTNVTRPEFVLLTVKQLEEKPVKYVLWIPRWGMPESGHLQEDHLGPFRDYLKTRYIPVHTFSNGDEIWEHR